MVGLLFEDKLASSALTDVQLALRDIGRGDLGAQPRQCEGGVVVAAVDDADFLPRQVAAIRPDQRECATLEGQFRFLRAPAP